jgi:hypothetical protein
MSIVLRRLRDGAAWMPGMSPGMTETAQLWRPFGDQNGDLPSGSPFTFIT